MAAYFGAVSSGSLARAVPLTFFFPTTIPPFGSCSSRRNCESGARVAQAENAWISGQAVDCTPQAARGGAAAGGRQVPRTERDLGVARGDAAESQAVASQPQ